MRKRSAAQCRKKRTTGHRVVAVLICTERSSPRTAGGRRPSGCSAARRDAERTPTAGKLQPAPEQLYSTITKADSRLSAFLYSPAGKPKAPGPMPGYSPAFTPVSNQCLVRLQKLHTDSMTGTSTRTPTTVASVELKYT